MRHEKNSCEKVGPTAVPNFSFFETSVWVGDEQCTPVTVGLIRFWNAKFFVFVVWYAGSWANYPPPPWPGVSVWVWSVPGSVLTYCHDTVGGWWVGRSGGREGGDGKCSPFASTPGRVTWWCPCPLTGVSITKGGSYYRQARPNLPCHAPGRVALIIQFRG